VPEAAAQPRERSQNVKVALAFEGHLNDLIFRGKKTQWCWGDLVEDEEINDLATPTGETGASRRMGFAATGSHRSARQA